ncbi:MAG: 2-hydroxyacid dehydrogenase [Ruminococcus sp.]|nr:2-hydroxyacid dehydrogenase [Ruminococcus sp.]
MESIAFFDAKPYDRVWFSRLNKNFDIHYFENRLTQETVSLAQGCSAVIPFVNDDLNATVIQKLYDYGVKIIAMRCSGFNNIDRKAANGKLKIVRVPGYSPYAVAEHAIGMLLCLNRKIHKAYFRTRDFNFSLNGLTGFDLYGKTVGVIGTGKIGQIFIKICQGFGMNVIAYDPYPISNPDFKYSDLDTLFSNSDIISLHCPLTEQSHHIINSESIKKMKDNVFLINTSRGLLIESESLLEGLRSGKISAAALDVYEEETDFFFEDYSDKVKRDMVLSMLLSMPNVLITSHQAFLTTEALHNIAEVTLQNLSDFYSGKELINEVR